MAPQAYAQSYSVADGRAIKFFQEGEMLLTLKKYPEALLKFQAAIARDEKFVEAYPERWYKNTILGQDLKEFFRFWTNDETKEQWGEDYGFCVDMRNAGVDVHVLIDAKTTHYGSFGYEADFSKLAVHYIKDVEVENG
jgi:hypothetical protein